MMWAEIRGALYELRYLVAVAEFWLFSFRMFELEHPARP
jgi:hypothetical protein